MICHECEYYCGGMTRVIVDSRVADEYEDGGCDFEDKMTDEDFEILNDKDECRFFKRKEDDGYDDWLEDQYKEQRNEE